MKASALLAAAGALALAAFTAYGSPLQGGPFTLTGQVTGGGGQSSGGGFALTGLVHEQFPGHYTGDGFALSSPAGIFQVSAGGVTLQIALTGLGEVVISWPDAAPGLRLQFSPALGPGALWEDAQPAPGAGSFTAPHSQRSMFYRIVQP